MEGKKWEERKRRRGRGEQKIKKLSEKRAEEKEMEKKRRRKSDAGGGTVYKGTKPVYTNIHAHTSIPIAKEAPVAYYESLYGRFHELGDRFTRPFCL